MESKRFGFISYENFPYLNKVEYESDNQIEITSYIHETYDVIPDTIKSRIMKCYGEDQSLETVFVFIVLDTNNNVIGYIWDRSMIL